MQAQVPLSEYGVRVIDYVLGASQASRKVFLAPLKFADKAQ